MDWTHEPSEPALPDVPEPPPVAAVVFLAAEPLPAAQTQPAAESRPAAAKKAPAKTAPAKAADQQTDPDAAPEPEPLDAPRDGVPPVIDTPQAYQDCVAAFAAGHGPVAIDAERASGHRYGQRAFLVQLRRAGAGTALIDPNALPDLSALNDALADAEWIIHAASQDLPCLFEVGMSPTKLFDTELGGRLAGYPRVGLAAMVERLLGYRLAKEHSAVDWSKRPLPEPWLRYAALDVEVLIELRDELAADLERQGKLEWAQQEFAALAAAPPAPARVDPWRRTSGMHRVRDRRRLAAVRELWTTREELARERDVSPGRLIPDSAIVEACLSMPATGADLTALAGFNGRGAGRYVSHWMDALNRARHLPAEDLPPQHLPADGPPPARLWNDRAPEAAARLGTARELLAELSETHTMPVENLVSPDAVRRLAWTPPEPVNAESVAAALAGLGARPWQVELVSGPLAHAFS